PVHTYSIVARDPDTGQLGVAVQSHWFSVGPIVPWAEAGVGAIATQSFADPAYGPLALELLRAGRTAEQALAGLLAADPHPEVRQVAIIDAAGNVAEGDVERALQEYATAESMVPDEATNGEMVFWHAVMLANLGRVDEALPLFRRAFAQDPNWIELVRRLPKAGQLPDDPALIERIVSAGTTAVRPR